MSKNWTLKKLEQRTGLQRKVSDEILLDLAYWFDLMDTNNNELLSLEELQAYFYYYTNGERNTWYSAHTIYSFKKNTKNGLTHDEFINFFLTVYRNQKINTKTILLLRKRYEPSLGQHPHHDLHQSENIKNFNDQQQQEKLEFPNNEKNTFYNDNNTLKIHHSTEI